MKPINQDESSVIKGNVPVKFRLADANGSFVSNATARLCLARVTSGVPGAEMEAVSTGNANIGNYSLQLTANNSLLTSKKAPCYNCPNFYSYGYEGEYGQV